MPQHPPFDITPEHILALDDEGLRLLIARLCKADLRRRGLPVSAVLYGGNQIAADGGIDFGVGCIAARDRFRPRAVAGRLVLSDCSGRYSVPGRGSNDPGEFPESGRNRQLSGVIASPAPIG